MTYKLKITFLLYFKSMVSIHPKKQQSYYFQTKLMSELEPHETIVLVNFKSIIGNFIWLNQMWDLMIKNIYNVGYILL